MPLPIDPVQLERTIAGAIASILGQVTFSDNVTPMFPHIHTRERFPANDDEDEALFGANDPVVGDKRLITNAVEIGLPGVGEDEYTSDEDTNLTLTYPITWSLGVVDKWAKPGFDFNSSGEMAIGGYMRARRKFKQARDLGLGQPGQNVVHYYLQQDGPPQTITNDKGEAVEHLMEWSLQVTVGGVKA